MLNNTLGMKKEAQEEYYALMGRLVQKSMKDQTALEDAAIKKRFGIANVYRKLDHDSAGFFFGQMSALMQTKSHALFEIGKAGAIAETIINTYAAAIGAYKAMASIPYIGPALGIAAAAAATLAGIANVNAIRNTTIGGGGAVGTFAANPSTGLPESPTSSGFEAQPFQQQGVAAQVPREINLTFIGSGRYTQEEIRDAVIPGLQEAFDAGVKVNFVNR